MVHHDWRHVTAAHERREQEIARLSQRRRETAQAPRAPNFYHRFLAHLGRKLVDLGWQLQSPYNRMTAPPTFGRPPPDPNLRLNC